MNGELYNETDIMRIYVNILEDFKKQNHEFIGVKLIHAPSKYDAHQRLEANIRNVLDLQQKFSKYFAGFDLVGQEDTSRNIFAFIDGLLSLPKGINLFLHAGETNWHGNVDLNLVI